MTRVIKTHFSQSRKKNGSNANNKDRNKKNKNPMIVHNKEMKTDINNYFDIIRSVVNGVAVIIKAEKDLPDREHCGTPEIVTESKYI